jgi:hypothetical protein
MGRVKVAIMIAGLTAMVGVRAHAQPTPMAADAKVHFDRGLRLYNVQSYEEAIAEFKAGYDIDPRPDFLYALGQSQRMRGDCPAAIVSYETFLRTGPADRQASAARAQIDTCRAEMAAKTPAAPPAETGPPLAPPIAPAPTPTLTPAPAPSPSAPLVAPAISQPHEQPDQHAPPIYRRWWFWTLVGGGVAAGLGIATAAGAFNRTVDAPCPGNRVCL